MNMLFPIPKTGLQPVSAAGRGFVSFLPTAVCGEITSIAHVISYGQMKA